MRSRKPLLEAALACGLLVTGTAQGQDTPTDAECFPKCRDGYLCHQGRCVSACNPPCGETEFCTSRGECVSACNPPCGPGEQCLPGGTCQPTGQAAPPGGGTPGRTAPPSEGPPRPTSPGGTPGAATGRQTSSQWGQPGTATGPTPGGGRARGRAIGGIVSSFAILGLGVGSTVTTGDQVPSTSMGGVATLLFLIVNPIVATGGNEARQHPSVDGVLGLRIAGWVLYGLTAVNALAAVGLGAADRVVHPAVPGTLTALGLLGTVFFAIDGFVTASEADQVKDSSSTGFAWAPSASLYRDPRGRLRPTLGITGRF